MTNHSEAVGGPGEQTITLRSPGELADALPYLMGFHPDDSVVLAAVHGDGGSFGGRVRVSIPERSEDWRSSARELARCLVKGSERRGGRPEGIVVFLCREPGSGEDGRQVMERLRPLATELRTACGDLGVPVREALCLSGGRFWSYVCADSRCCPPDGTPMALPGTSVLAAAATYAGLQVRGSMQEMEARISPYEGGVAEGQRRALDAAAAALLPRILEGQGARQEVEDETLAAARRAMDRLRDAPLVRGALAADVRDDTLLDTEEAAGLILGLQDREARDRAAEWMEGEDAGPALRLWRALARRCVGPYAEHAAAPLTLAGWVAWSMGDEPEARVALGMALRLDPYYTFAKLLHHACNEGLDPESVRQCLRQARTERRTAKSAEPTGTTGPAEPTKRPDRAASSPQAASTESAERYGGDRSLPADGRRLPGVPRQRRRRPGVRSDSRRPKGPRAATGPRDTVAQKSAARSRPRADRRGTRDGR